MIRFLQRKTGWIASAALLAAAGLAMAEATPTPKPVAGAARPPEASIAFANRGGIRDWQADSDRGMWVQDNHNRWYYGRFMGPCLGLQFAEAVRFRTGASDQLDRWSSVRARDTGNCTFTSFVLSDGPPRKVDRKPKVKAAQPAVPAPVTPAPAAPAGPGAAPPTG
jgi:hypothetical protein